jgi:hypothetical protein
MQRLGYCTVELRRRAFFCNFIGISYCFQNTVHSFTVTIAEKGEGGGSIGKTQWFVIMPSLLMWKYSM